MKNYWKYVILIAIYAVLAVFTGVAWTSSPTAGYIMLGVDVAVTAFIIYLGLKNK